MRCRNVAPLFSLRLYAHLTDLPLNPEFSVHRDLHFVSIHDQIDHICAMLEPPDLISYSSCSVGGDPKAAVQVDLKACQAKSNSLHSCNTGDDVCTLIFRHHGTVAEVLLGDIWHLRSHPEMAAEDIPCKLGSPDLP